MTEKKYDPIFSDHVTESGNASVNILVSACLLGVNCRYNGIEKEHVQVKELISSPGICLIPVCPEQLGGLSTPRPASECVRGSENVILPGQGSLPAAFAGVFRVVHQDGTDVTEQYNRGASEALKLAKMYGCQAALLKERSPSCGSGRIYDGTFSGTLTDGDGVTAALLKENGIRVYGESQISEIVKDLKLVGRA